MSSKAKVVRPPWHTPQSTPVPTLKLYNSLTKQNDEFIPKNGRRVTWYNCGPTVYDASHMGHARTYLTLDIVRRVMEDYFKYDILFVQNITDVDDKIILRARQLHLFENLKSSTTILDQALVDQVETAWASYANSKLSKSGLGTTTLKDWPVFSSSITPDILAKALIVDEKFKMYLAALKSTHDGIETAKIALKSDPSKQAAINLLNASQDVMLQALDEKHGSEVNDPKLFLDFPAYWESKYFEDMDALNIRPPDVQTRVSEYIPEIITYVQKIIGNGYAYSAEGSVYFDTVKYDGHNDHCYLKLEPGSKGNVALIQDGEGSLGSRLYGKKNINDFALWKASKPGEPAWDSPWGKGRPGWHIECSVMASAVTGDSLDIHSGGIDLAFPHHDNEIAQSEAFFDSKQWVNYFMHTGHLHIEGQKMSKSYKNFITIQKVLEKYTSRQLRLFFLDYQWDVRMDFKETGMQEIIQQEQTIKNFFDTCKALLFKILHDGSRGADVLPDGSITHRYREPERELVDELMDTQDKVHAALCNSINTPVAMVEIMNLISRTNRYMSCGAKVVNPHVIEKVARWITSMLKVFGVADSGAEIGFTGSGGEAGVSEDALLPYLRTLSVFRDDIRKLARQGGTAKDILEECDRLRDVHLVDLGVSLDDQEDGTALVKLVPRAELIEVRDRKKAQQAAKEAKKAEAAAERERKRLERLERGKVQPEEMFKVSGEYSQFDDQGIPTHTKDGEPLSKNQLKKLKKEWDAQGKLHQEYLQHCST